MTKDEIKRLEDRSQKKFQAYVMAENNLLVQEEGLAANKALDDFTKAYNEWKKANDDCEKAWQIFNASLSLNKAK